jgi:hypothetical protein
MSKLGLATRLADELGTSVAKASRFIDDVGARRAESLLDDASSRGSRQVSNWMKAGAGAGAVGGGALLWREQDVRRAEALANQQQSYSDALTALIDADLPPDIKRALAEDLADSSGGGGGGQPDDVGEGLLAGAIGSDPATLIVLLIVLVFVLKFALAGGDD